MKKILFLIMVCTASVGHSDTWNLGTLSTPNTTAAILAQQNSNHTFQYVITEVSTNIVVRAEGSLDNSNWFNFESDNTTKNANGTYSIHKSSTPMKYVRLNWVSKDPVAGGGTTPNVSVKYMGNN